jgi:amidohydrolase
MTGIHLDELKSRAIAAVAERETELWEVLEYIHTHPETCFAEYQASGLLVDKLRQYRFEAQAGVAGLETAFTATYAAAKPGPNIGIFAEYDALPEIGHGCGHNIMATVALGAGIAVSKLIEETGGKVTVCGTPAEEGGGGKVIMLDRGVFDPLDAALILHPANETVVEDVSYSRCDYEVTFKGKPAHAATFPDQGISPITPLIQLFNMVDALRFEIADRGKIHGYIKYGGDNPIMIPDHTTCVFTIRSFDMTYRTELTERFLTICRSLAAATRTELEYHQTEPNYEDIRNNETIQALLQQNLEQLGETIRPRRREQGIGCTDMGNISHRIPAIQSYIGLGEELKGHTREFAAAAGDARGLKAAVTGAKALAMTAIDLLAVPANMQAVRKHFAEMRKKKMCY